jgi:hypothetical protein
MTTVGVPPEGKSEVQSQGKGRVDVPTVFGCLSIALSLVSAVLRIGQLLPGLFTLAGWLSRLGNLQAGTYDLSVVLMALCGLILGWLGMRAGRRQASERGYQLSRAGAVLSVGLVVPSVVRILFVIGLSSMY